LEQRRTASNLGTRLYLDPFAQLALFRLSSHNIITLKYPLKSLQITAILH
jgi:hypothetical protein